MTTVESGRALPGPYTDLVQIGRGGSSTVYRARSAAFERDVAIKVFHGTVDDPGLQARFRRECRLLGSLGDHPHVVSVFDSGFTADRRPFIVMPHCSGGSLGQRLAGQGPRPVDEVVAIGLAVADALAAAHARGVVHRDVKPHNVLLTTYGVVTLADFGVAAPEAFDQASMAATPGYVAPEVIVDHHAISPAADLYALGATLFALLEGGPPARQRPEEADVAFMLRCVEEPPPPLRGDVPEPVAEVIRACMAKDPAERPASAQQVVHDLRAAAVRSGITPPARLPLLPLPDAGGPWQASGTPEISGEPPTQDQPAARPRRRGPVLAAASVLAIGLAGAALVLANQPGGPVATPAAAAPRTSAPSLAQVTPSPVTTVEAPVTREAAARGKAGDRTRSAGPGGGRAGGKAAAGRRVTPTSPAPPPSPGPTTGPTDPPPGEEPPGPDPTTDPTTDPTDEPGGGPGNGNGNGNNGNGNGKGKGGSEG